jgi:hypothetical protein
MSNQEPMLSAQEISTRNLVSHIESNINQEGNKQLMLFLGICLNDIDIVNRAVGLGADVAEVLSNRNHWILNQMGYITNPPNAPERPVSPINVQDIHTN